MFAISLFLFLSHMHLVERKAVWEWLKHEKDLELNLLVTISKEGNLQIKGTFLYLITTYISSDVKGL